MTAWAAASVRRLAPVACQLVAAAAPALLLLATFGATACILAWAAGLLRGFRRGFVGRP